MAKKVIPVVLVMAFVFCIAVSMSTSVKAEEPSMIVSLYADKLLMSYKVYQYPSGVSSFYLPRHHEIKFDVHNGKFYKLEYFTFEGEIGLNAFIFFYSPEGELIAYRHEKQWNFTHSVPHNERSPHYDRLIIRIQNRSDDNKDFRFLIYDPVEPVLGVPMRGATYK